MPDEEMSATETARAAYFAVIKHRDVCLPCLNAFRWADMCEQGKTLYDDMYAAAKALSKEQRNE